MTMRSIILLRHGEAEADSTFGNDHARRLTSRGISQIQSVSETLHQLAYRPDVIYCSDSRRTTETHGNLSANFVTNRSVNFLRDLYDAGPHDILDFIYGLDDAVRTVLFIGHNPGLSHLAAGLSQRVVNLGTGSAVILRLAVPTWTKAASSGAWHLAHHLDGEAPIEA